MNSVYFRPLAFAFFPLAVFAADLKDLAVGAPFEPAFLIVSPLPFLIRLRFA